MLLNAYKPKNDWKTTTNTAVNINKVTSFKILSNVCECKQDKSWCNLIYRFEVFVL